MPSPSDFITVLIPTSPIPSHPSTEVIDKTIASVREHLPEAQIIIMCDGVRAEQEHRRAAYEEYKRALAKYQTYPESDAIHVLQFADHTHQAEMTSFTLSHVLPEVVRTPLLLFMEHDTFFTGPIDWEGCAETVLSGNVNMLGFYCMLQPWIHPAHQHLLVENARTNYAVPVARTWQWSQRPHLASVDFYRRVMTHFTPESRTMIEDRMYEVVMADRSEGRPWETWKLAYYAPEGDINRSHTLDGRQGDPKYGMRF